MRYRYYVSCLLAQGRKAEAGSVARVAAPELEAAVVAALREADPARRAHLSEGELIEVHLERVEVRPGLLTLVPQASSGAETINVPWQPSRAVTSRAVIVPPDAEGSSGQGPAARPTRSEARARLVAGIAQARAWLDELVSGQVASTQVLAVREGVSERAVRMTLNLAFLSPELIKAAVAGTLPREAGLTSLADAPIAWTQQQMKITR